VTIPPGASQPGAVSVLSNRETSSSVVSYGGFDRWAPGEDPGHVARDDDSYSLRQQCEVDPDGLERGAVALDEHRGPRAA